MIESGFQLEHVRNNMAFDAYVKFDGIEGETTDAQHKDWIEITSYNFGVSQKSSDTASSAGGASVGRANIREFYFTKACDKAKPKLFSACCKGEHINNVTISINRAGGEKLKYLEITLEEVLISDFISQGSEGEPSEHIELSYGRIKITYIQQKRADGTGGGNIAGGWDRVGNKPYA